MPSGYSRETWKGTTTLSLLCLFPLLSLTLSSPDPLLCLLPLLSLTLSSPDPLICNAATPYACDCGSGHATATLPGCVTFIKGASSVRVVELRMRHVRMEARLADGSSYEEYFKRRVAALVSAACERETNSCARTQLRLSPANVFILRVEKETNNVTRVVFAISRREKSGGLSAADLLEPSRIKYILESEAAPLARALGGVRIASVRVTRAAPSATGTERTKMPAKTITAASLHSGERADAGTNHKLILIFGTAAAFFIICYIIGGIKMYRDHKKRVHRKKEEDEQTEMVGTKRNAANYGACEGENGRVSLSLQQPLLSTQEEEERREEDSFPSWPSARPRLLSDREARRMFACDPSQLPKELSIDDSLSLSHSPLQSSQKRQKNNEGEGKAEKRESRLPSVPALLLVTTDSRDSALSSADDELVLSGSALHPSAGDPSMSSSPPTSIHRPKSRRGSRVDDTAETIDLAHDIPEMAILQQNKQPSNDEQRRSNDEEATWSSSEGEVDVYYKLSEDDEIVKGDDWAEQHRNGVIRQGKDERNFSLDQTHEKEKLKIAGRVIKGIQVKGGNEDEEDEEEEDEGTVGYERLWEDMSPLPPPVKDFLSDGEDSLR